MGVLILWVFVKLLRGHIKKNMISKLSNEKYTLFAANPNTFMAAFTVIVFLISTAVYAADPIVFNDNGGWCWYQDERVIVHDGKLIIGSVANASGTGGASRNGNIEVVTHDIATGVTSTPFVLHANLEADDHDLPAFLVRPDDRILAVYSKHGRDKNVRYRITTNPGDTSAWGSELIYYHEPYNVTYSRAF